MDASVPQQPSDSVDISSRGKQPWYLRRYGIVVVLSTTLVIATLPLSGLLTIVLRAALNNPTFYAHQTELNTWLSVISSLVLPSIIVTVAIMVTRGSTVGSRTATLLRLGAVPLLIALLTWVETPIFTAVFTAEMKAPHATGPLLFSYFTFYWSATINGIGSGIVTGLLLILLVRLLAPALLPGDPARRTSAAVLMGALAGLVVAIYAIMPTFLLKSYIDLRLAYIGDTGCSAGSGGGCYPAEMWLLIRSSVLPRVVGAAVGCALGALLIPALRTITPLPTASAPTRRARRITTTAFGAAYLAFGILCVLLTLFVIGHTGGSIALYPLPYASMPLLAFVLSIAIFVIVVSRNIHARAAAARPVLRIIAFVGIIGALAIPLSLLVWQQLLESDPNTAIVLEAYCLGAGVAAIAMLRATDASWRRGLRAAGIGWLGVVLVGLVIIVLVFIGYVIPGSEINSSTCHGLGCGALLVAVTNIIFSISLNLILYGLPAALLAGSAVGLLGSPPFTAVQSE